MSKYTEAGVTLNGEMLYKKAEEKKEPEKAQEFNISVLNGKVYGGRVTTEKDWQVFHVTKQECATIQVRQVLPGDLILTPSIIQEMWNTDDTLHSLDSFIATFRALKK